MKPEGMFAYGTLMFPEIYSKVLNFHGPSVQNPIPACLPHYRRGRIPGTPYPGIWPHPEGQVQGFLYPLPTPTDLQRLDDYEDDHYHRTLLQVATSKKLLSSWVYLPQTPSPIPWRDWNPEDFHRPQ